ncbi:hypothetical protein BLOT_014677, partial [Blomia tropicalis]
RTPSRSSIISWLSSINNQQPTNNQHSQTPTWLPIIGIILSNINLAADNWDHSSTIWLNLLFLLLPMFDFNLIAMVVVAFLMANLIKLFKQMAVALLMVNRFNHIELLKQIVVASMFSNICGGAFDRRFQAI